MESFLTERWSSFAPAGEQRAKTSWNTQDLTPKRKTTSPVSDKLFGAFNIIRVQVAIIFLMQNVLSFFNMNEHTTRALQQFLKLSLPRLLRQPPLLARLSPVLFLYFSGDLTFFRPSSLNLPPLT